MYSLCGLWATLFRCPGPGASIIQSNVIHVCYKAVKRAVSHKCDTSQTTTAYSPTKLPISPSPARTQ